MMQKIRPMSYEEAYTEDVELALQKSHEECERLRSDLQRATSMPMVSEAARNVALERKYDELRTELAAAQAVIEQMHGLLRESLVKFEAYEQHRLRAPINLMRRMREALGDE